MLLTRHRHRYRHRYRSTYAVSTVTGWGLRTAVGTRTRRTRRRGVVARTVRACCAVKYYCVS